MRTTLFSRSACGKQAALLICFWLAVPARAQQVAPLSENLNEDAPPSTARNPLRMPVLPARDDDLAELSASVGASHWSGDFGADSDTSITSALLNVRLRRGDLRISVTLPWMDIRTRGMAFAGINGTPLVVAPSISSRRVHRDGLGDVTAGVSWLAVKEDVSGVDIDLSARIKAPTASDSSGLSTGQSDAYFGAEVTKPLGRITPGLRIGYRTFGDPVGWNIRDGFSGSAEIFFNPWPKTFASLSYDYAQKTNRSIADAQEIVLGASQTLTRTLRLNGFVSAGLSSGASDFAGGVSLSFAL